MLDKITLGTANFVNSYGILSPHAPLSKDDIHLILEMILKNNITSLDTAMGYGDFLKVIPEKILSKFNYMTKFSVLDDNKELIEKFDSFKKNKYFPFFEGVLIHDPHNISLSNTHKIKDIFKYLREEYGIKKIGVSVYDMQDIEKFYALCKPDIIQIPLNPFNQTFNTSSFKTFVKENDVDVYARSLFLQGILLADSLPSSLEPLKSYWFDFCKVTDAFPSRLQALLSWAFDFNWIKSWVLGVASVDNLQDIINEVAILGLENKENPLNIFKAVAHPLVDPRNWKVK